MNIHKKIRLAREGKYWSQEKMATKLCMSPNGYAKIERGQTKLYIDKLQQIAQVLDMDIFELMSLGEKEVVPPYDKDRNHENLTDNEIRLMLSDEIDRLKLTIFYQKKLLAQKQSEIDTLKDMISLLKTPADRP